MNNYLSPGLRDHSDLFKAYLGVANVLNQFQLGLSFFHVGFTSVDTMISEVALGLEQLFSGRPMEALKSFAKAPLSPFTTARLGRKVAKEWETPGSQNAEIAAIVDAVIAGGGRAKQDEFYRAQMVRGMKDAFESGNLLGGILRVPFAAVEAVAMPVMEHIVPYQKLGVFAKLLQEAMRKNPMMTHDELRDAAAKAWASVDNRLGQVVYDNLFWKKWIKDLGMASVRSLGWNMGTFREVGGGLYDLMKAGGVLLRGHGNGGSGGGNGTGKGGSGGTDEEGPRIIRGRKPEFTHRMAYTMALPLVVGTLGALITYLFTGKGPDELKDYFFPKVGGVDAKGNPQRVSLPSYMKDIYAYWEAPGTTLTHKLHPALAILADMLRNEDFYGVQIRNPDDTIIKQALQELGYVGKSFEPFGIRGARQLSKSGATPGRMIAPIFGVTPAPASINQSAAAKKAAEINRARMPSAPITEQERERRIAKSDLVQQVRQGKTSGISAAVRSGTIKASDVPQILSRAKLTPLQASVNTMSIEQVQKVMKVATPAEKRQIAPILARKVEHSSGVPMFTGF